MYQSLEDTRLFGIIPLVPGSRFIVGFDQEGPERSPCPIVTIEQVGERPVSDDLSFIAYADKAERAYQTNVFLSVILDNIFRALGSELRINLVGMADSDGNKIEADLVASSDFRLLFAEHRDRLCALKYELVKP